MGKHVTAYYTGMPQADLDALAAIVDACGMKDVLAGLADWATQTGYACDSIEFHLRLGYLAGTASKIDRQEAP